MKQYEQILDKVAPTFYKTIQYGYYSSSQINLYYSYLEHAKIGYSYLEHAKIGYDTYYFRLPTKNIYYYYILWYTPADPLKSASKRMIALITKDKRPPEYDVFYAHSLIIDMILNNFSFENEHIPYFRGSVYKTLFIAMVGRDLYDTLRANIR